MAGTVEIGKLQVRYRVPQAAAAARAQTLRRLERARERAFGDALARAIERLGIPPSEHVCIRVLRVPLHLGRDDLAALDEAVRAWSEAVAGAIAEAMRSGATDRVVRYGSRAHALADLALCVARGDLHRAWAWRQMDLARLPDSPSSAQASAALMAALARHPGAIVPVLREVAGAGFLAALAARMSRASWLDLAAMALAAADAGTAALGTWPPGAAAGAVEPEQAAYTRTAAWRHRLATATLTRALCDHTPALLDAPDERHALAALAVLDMDAAAFRGLDMRAARALIHTATRTLESVRRAHAAGPELEVEHDHEFGQDHGGEHTPERAHAAPPAHEREVRGRAHEPDHAPRHEPDLSRPAHDHATAPRHEPDPSEPAHAPDPAPHAPDPAPHAPHATTRSADRPGAQPGARSTARTDMAGLLFLVRVLDAGGLIDPMLENPVVRARSLSWTLHQLALQLVSVTPHDPAALAFAGLPPHAPPPSTGQSPADPDERALLASLHARTHAALRALLDSLDLPAPALMELVCRRRGGVIADPGWIEIHLSLDHVSPDIRRAGLDLDPGWVPWLGAVLRFVYA